MQNGSGLVFRYCPVCSAPLRDAAPAHCPACGYIHYRNPPAVVAGILLTDGPRLPPADHAVPVPRATHALLVRRTATHAGAWCLPCGYIEYEEEIRAAACREFLEETGLTVAAAAVYAVQSNFHDPHNHTVGTWFMMRYLGGELRPGDDADRAEFFPLAAPPGPLAFPTDRQVLAALAAGEERLP
jgi:ADP-ribose pyrophosphatase YjhB (NUDIX family)